MIWKLGEHHLIVINTWQFPPLDILLEYRIEHVVVVVVNFISDRQYKNKDKFLTKQNTPLLIAVRGHQRSPWAHRAGGLEVHMFIKQPGAEQVRLEIMRHNGR